LPRVGPCHLLEVVSRIAVQIHGVPRNLSRISTFSQTLFHLICRARIVDARFTDEALCRIRLRRRLCDYRNCEA
jgi:hypothetical protein